MLAVVCYLWRAPGGGCAYSAADVLRLKRQLACHLTLPHVVVCATDDVDQFAGTGIRAVALVPPPHRGRMFAAEKLMTFHPRAGELFGSDRILACDLDVVILGNLDAIVGRDEDLVLWRNPSRQPWAAPSRRALYNSSLVLVTAGVRRDIWDRAAAGEAVHWPGDQDWISAVVGPDCPYWDGTHGVYRIGRSDTPGSGVGAVLPENARMIFCPGDEGKPWQASVRRSCPWLEEHWPL